MPKMMIDWHDKLDNQLEQFIQTSFLVGLVLLTDIRHPLKYFDEQMLYWAKDGDLPVHVLLTKSDKLKFGAAKTALLDTQRTLAKLDLPFSVQLFSSLNKSGIDELASVLGDWLKLDDVTNGVDNG